MRGRRVQAGEAPRRGDRPVSGVGRWSRSGSRVAAFRIGPENSSAIESLKSILRLVLTRAVSLFGAAASLYYGAKAET
jgi:hypothetical protein